MFKQAFRLSVSILKGYMRLDDFNRMDQYQQLREVWERGTLLFETRRYNVYVYLFQLGKFYVELCTLKRNDKVIMINAFDDTKSLEPYLDEIDISSLGYLIQDDRRNQ